MFGMSNRFLHIGMIGSLPALLLGCGREPGPLRVPLHGTVQVEGVRVEEGSLTLLPLPGHRAPAATTPILAGSYAFTQATGPVPGPHRAVVGVSLTADNVAAAGAVADNGAADAPPADAAIKAAPRAAHGRGGDTGSATPSQWELRLEVPAEGDHRADLNFGTK
jgi:hypothetical protein